MAKLTATEAKMEAVVVGNLKKLVLSTSRLIATQPSRNQMEREVLMIMNKARLHWKHLDCEKDKDLTHAQQGRSNFEVLNCSFTLLHIGVVQAILQSMAFSHIDTRVY